MAVTTGMLLRRSSTIQEFASGLETVLPAYNTVRAIFDGSLCFTVQAENSSALEALWERYQDGTLQRNLQEFLVTEEIKQLADGDVMVTVQIDEQEYKNAIFDLMITETQGNYRSPPQRHPWEGEKERARDDGKREKRPPHACFFSLSSLRTLYISLSPIFHIPDIPRSLCGGER